MTSKPLTPRHRAVLDALTEVARPIILEQFNPDSCIASTRIGIDALAYFGLRGEPLPVSALLFNPEAMDLLQHGTTMEDLKAQMDLIPADGEGGPWSLGLGLGSQQPGAWAGHLVVALKQHHTIVDLSADQASRPHKNMPVQPYHVTIDDPDWWSGTQPAATFTTSNGTALILDRRSPDPDGYRRTPNWTMTGSTDKALYKDLTGRVIRAVNASL